MPRRARVECVSLRSSLVNLPISLYGPLLERNIRPQALAVHLSNPNVNVFLGWTGMPSASSLVHFSADSSFDTVEIDPQYALALGLSQGDTVDIGLLHDLPRATSVATEPLTSDDWEIIESQASHVESTLLSQVRVANIGQEIDVWVLGRTRVRLIVVSIDPVARGNAVLLATNSRVSIAPKPHTSTKHSSTLSPPTTSQAPPKPAPFRHMLRVIPARVLPHSVHTPHAGPETLAVVSPHIFAELTRSQIPFHPANASSDAKSNVNSPSMTTYYKCTALRLPPPSLLDHESTKASSPAIVPHISNPSSSDTTKNDQAGLPNINDREVEVYVGCSTHIPERHIAPAFLWEGLGEWDLIQITLAPAEKATITIDHKHLDDTPHASSITTPTSTSVLAGVNDILARCTNFCLCTLALHASKPVVHGVPALLVAGRSGVGKTSIVQAVSKAMQEDRRTYMYTLYVDFARYAEQSVSELKTRFRHWFEIAAWHSPTVLIFDNMETLLAVELEHADSFRTRQLTEIFISIYSSSTHTISANARGIVILGTAPSQAALHPLLSTLHLFKDVINVKPPNRNARKDIIAHIVQRRVDAASDIRQEPDTPLNYALLAGQTEGYAPMDLEDLVARAVHQAAMRVSTLTENKVTLTHADFDAAQADFVPLSLRNIGLQKSDVVWADIGGLRDVKRVLRETLEWPTKYGPIFAQAPLRLRSGLLLYGFPGCGKTLLASAIAKECGLNFIGVKGPEILNKYIGASEKSVRDLFDRASAAKPCILFFDEFDAIAPKRGHDSTGVTDRVVNQMLTQMDGAEGLDGVYVLAATSRPDLIDSALLRPGRLDKSLFCDLPNVEDRKDILYAVARKVKISPTVDMGEIARATEGFSGADLQALVYNAHLEVVHASIAAAPVQDRGKGNDYKSSAGDKVPVRYTIFGGPADGKMGVRTASRAEEADLQRRLRQIQSASRSTSTVVKTARIPPQKREIMPEDMRLVLKKTRPSVSPEERERLGRIYHSFVSDRNGKLPLPPNVGGVGNRVSLM